jgi:hypothetical protein
MNSAALDVNELTGVVTLTKTADSSAVEKNNADLRKEIGKGFTKSRLMRAVADIPLDFLHVCALNGEVSARVLMESDPDPVVRRKALRNFLYKYPEFRISEGRL